MKTLHIFAIAFLLLAAPAAMARPSRVKDANRSWPTFWRQITTAINKKDRIAVRKMMPNDFFDGGGGLTPDEWLKFIDENERAGSWRNLRKSFAGGSIVNREWSAKGVPTGVTRDNAYYFEFRKDRKWYFAGVVGD